MNGKQEEKKRKTKEGDTALRRRVNQEKEIKKFYM